MKHVSPYLTPKQLGLSKDEHKAIFSVATALASGTISAGAFNMGLLSSCIFAHLPSAKSAELLDKCERLFYPTSQARRHDGKGDTWRRITRRQAAQACFNFLSTGKPNWRAILKGAGTIGKSPLSVKGTRNS